MPIPKIRAHVATFQDESEFEADSFRTRSPRPNVSLISGQLKGKKARALHRAEFDADRFSLERVQSWLARHGYSGAQVAEAPPEEPKPPAEEIHARFVDMGDGTFDIEGIEVLDVGRFLASKGGEVVVTQADINRIAADTQANLSYLKPPGKLGHTENPFPEGKGAPAVGWARNIYARGSKLLVDMTKVPATFVEALRLGRWRTRSAELMAWKHPVTGKIYTRVLKAIAWLGAEMPAVQTLADVVALSLSGDEMKIWADVEAQALATYWLTAAEADTDPDRTGETPPEDPNPESIPPEDDPGDEPEDTNPDGGGDMPNEKPTAEELAAAEARKELVEATLEICLTQGRITPAQVETQRAFATEHLTTLPAIRAWGNQLKALPTLPDETEPEGTQNKGEGKDASTSKDGEDPLANLTGEEWLTARADQIHKEKGWDEDRFGDAITLASIESPEQFQTYGKDAFPVVASRSSKED